MHIELQNNTSTESSYKTSSSESSQAPINQKSSASRVEESCIGHSDLTPIFQRKVKQTDVQENEQVIDVYDFRNLSSDAFESKEPLVDQTSDDLNINELFFTIDQPSLPSLTAFTVGDIAGNANFQLPGELENPYYAKYHR